MISVTNYVEGIIVRPKTGLKEVSVAVQGAFPWQNPINRFDVLNDGVVNTNDLNALLDFIESHRQSAFFSIELPKIRDGYYYDIDGDGIVTIRDVIQLAKFLRLDYSYDGLDSDDYSYNDIIIQRDLFDATKDWHANAIAGLMFAIPSSNYKFFLRDFNSQEFTEISSFTKLLRRQSVVVVHNSLYDVGSIEKYLSLASSINARIGNHLSSHLEILPSRNVP